MLLGSLTDADLERTITIRAEPHSVMQAVNRQIAHYAYHVGQIVYLSRHFARDQWKSLTIPKKKSTDLNAKLSGTDARRNLSPRAESPRR